MEEVRIQFLQKLFNSHDITLTTFDGEEYFIGIHDFFHEVTHESQFDFCMTISKRDLNFLSNRDIYDLVEWFVAGENSFRLYFKEIYNKFGISTVESVVTFLENVKYHNLFPEFLNDEEIEGC